MKTIIAVFVLFLSTNAIAQGWELRVISVSTKEERSYWYEHTDKMTANPVNWLCGIPNTCRVEIMTLPAPSGKSATLVCTGENGAELSTGASEDSPALLAIDSKTKKGSCMMSLTSRSSKRL